MMVPNFDGLGVVLLVAALISFGLGYWVCALVN